MNGSCPSGCDAGAYGDKCDIGSTISYRIYLTFFNVVSNGGILLPLNNHIGVESYFTALPLNKENVLYKDLFIKDMDENICIYL